MAPDVQARYNFLAAKLAALEAQLLVVKSEADAHYMNREDRASEIQNRVKEYVAKKLEDEIKEVGEKLDKLG